MAQRRKTTNNSSKKTIISTLAVVIALTCSFCIITISFLHVDGFWGGSNASDFDTSSVVSEPEDTGPKPVVKVSTATVVSTGDLLMHLPIIDNAYDKASGTYNFDNIFTMVNRYTSSADYAVANLETTLRGTEDGGVYSGYPKFNCPDTIVDAVKNAGFDMLLTANNHSYDTRYKGMIRTLEVIDSMGVARLGVVKSEEEQRYTVKDINGIKVGMTCFTYETVNKNEGCISLNGIPLTKEASALVNAFNYDELDEFYEKVKAQIEGMKKQGAEATVLYIHWGNEYKVKANQKQTNIAQKLCNLGVDVIVGGHPHVVEPVELLTSETDPTHKTVCVYSLGNFVSNQRTERMNLKTGHTEDGMLFYVTFAKYSDGTVVLENVDIIPTWVNLFTDKSTGKKVYQILPLDKNITDWKTEFNLSDAGLKDAEDSYNRTEKIVGNGLEKVKLYLSDPEKYKETYESTEADTTSSKAA